MAKHNYLYILLLLFPLFHSCTGGDQTPPNIVLIMSDDQGFGDFGFTGNQWVETPNLDELKKESLYFDRFYVSPVCAPTRASLLTGRYHLRTGTTWVTHGQEVMDHEEKTIAESLKEHGYATGCFGKWHNGEHYPHDPAGQGFDTFFGFCAGHWNNYFNTELISNGREVKTEGYIIDILTDSALHFMEKNRNRPFFCYVPYNTPHGPFQVADRYFNKYKAQGLDDKNAAVYGMCENIDDNVGRVLEKIEELGISDNTIVLYLTDNGPNGKRYNAGMKGTKAHVDEGGIRTPLLMRYPGVLPTGDTVHGISSHIDLLPTLHGLAGLEFREALPLDGIDLTDYLVNGKVLPDRKIFTHQVHRVLRPSPASVRTPSHRLVIQNGDTMLFDMITDPGQKKNIAIDNPQMTAELAKELGDWYLDVTSDYEGIPPIPVGYEKSPQVTLPAPEALLSGSLEFQGKAGWANDWIIGFDESEESSANWNLEVVSAGDYLVIAQIASPEPLHPGGMVISSEEQAISFNLDKAWIAPEVKVYDRVERTEANERDWPEAEIGMLTLKEGNQKIHVSGFGSACKDLELKQLIFTKIN